jgi:hypothetical protein
MSKGNKVVPVRLDPVLIERIHEALASKNAKVFEEEWTFSRWVRDACWQKLSHLGAGKKQREKRRNEKNGRAGRVQQLGELLKGKVKVPS